MTVGSDMKNPYIIPAAMICAAILAGFWMLKSPSEPQEVIVAEAAKPEPTTAKAPDIPLWEAAMNGNIEAVKQHLAAGADVNAKDKGGGTSLHFSAYGGHKETAELLIANGADVNVKNRVGETPLDVAINKNRTETADLLRKHGGKTREELKAEGK